MPKPEENNTPKIEILPLDPLVMYLHQLRSQAESGYLPETNESSPELIAKLVQWGKNNIKDPKILEQIKRMELLLTLNSKMEQGIKNFDMENLKEVSSLMRQLGPGIFQKPSDCDYKFEDLKTMSKADEAKVLKKLVDLTEKESQIQTTPSPTKK